VTGSLRSVILKLAVFTAITLSLTGLLASVIGNIQPFTRFYDVRAEFSDVTGLLNTDVVKVAGVTVGKVSGSEVVIDERTGEARAVVKMAVRHFVDIPRNARAAIKFRNLLGQRMIVITRDKADLRSGEPQAPLLPKDGKAVIPLAQTSPAFDLGIVFNNLKPVLATLSAEDVNTLSHALVRVFGGREARVQKMVSDLADITQALGSRGAVVTELVTNLAGVAKTVASRDDELGSIIDSLDTIITTLGGRSGELARAADNLGVASAGTADVLAKNRPALDKTIAQLKSILDVVDRNRTELDAALRTLPSTTHALSRATTYGTWVNLNIVCLNDICGPGFSSASASSPSARSAAVRRDALAAILLGLRP
jgi:phospholipid/cholesterol/gamma-HCH transport system substrate-binding protein